MKRLCAPLLLLNYICVKRGELGVNFNFDDQSLEMNAAIFRSERAKEGPTFKGKVREFCRQKGHGFIIPDHEKNPIFVHISEYVFILAIIRTLFLNGTSICLGKKYAGNLCLFF